MGGGGGLRAALKQKAAGESLSLMEVSGQGTVYFAVDAQDITIIELNNDALHVEASQLLALVGQLRPDVKFAGLRGDGSGQRSEERRVGEECVSTCRSRWSPTHSK